mgnify:CR=1 FL=1
MILDSGKVMLWSLACTFEPNLTDTILQLEQHKSYTFYGTVKESYGSPYLHIEAIK